MNIGQRVGDYEIVEVLGAGGMGEVFKVRNVLSHRIEAMKVLLPNLGGDPGLAERFLREIQVQATLDHPNIARLHTAHMAGEQLVMILEYVEGSTIEKLLEHGTLGVKETVHYIQQVLDALAYAHERGVVHRDIKPANIMRTPQGNVKLMDFGIARMQQDRKLTQTGSTVGSLFYMSPEQIKGGQPDPRSDLYSLGITMYEMVTGRRPFEGTSDYTIMAAHLQQSAIPPIEVIPGVPQLVNDIILMAIAKEPGERFQSAQAFRAALDSVGAGAPPPVAAHSNRTVTAPNVPPPVPPGAYGAPTGVSRLPQQPPPQYSPQSAAPPPPQPPPQYAAPQYAGGPPNPPAGAPWISPPAPTSRRGLYMTLGSIATVGVIALAIFAAPRFLHTGAANPAQTGNSSIPQQASDPAQPVATQPSGQPAGGTQPAVSEPGVSTPVATTPASTPAVTPASTPASTGPVSTTPVPVTPPANPQKGSPPPVAQQNPITPPVLTTPPVIARPVPQTPPGQSQPVPTQPPVQQPPAQQQPPVQAQEPPPGRRPAASPELAELRQDYNLISVRAASAKSGLRVLENQMRRQGLDMRGDIIEAESRMDYLMKESQDSIRAGEAVAARRDLRMAERALETVEKFLGR